MRDDVAKVSYIVIIHNIEHRQASSVKRQASSEFCTTKRLARTTELAGEMLTLGPSGMIMSTAPLSPSFVTP